MDISLPISFVRLETVKAKNERKYYRIIRRKFRPVLLVFQKSLQRVKELVLTSSRREDENRRDWRKLNIELLHLISKKMENISNFIHFRVVCKDWCLAIDPTDAPAQLPWLIWPTSSKETRLVNARQETFDKEYFVYSFSSDTTQQIRFPVSNILIGTFAGFVLVQEYPSSIFFLNLLTGAKVALSFLNPSNFYGISCLGHGSRNNYSNIVGTEIFLLITDQPVLNAQTIKYKFIRFRPPNTIKCISIILPQAAVFGYYKGRIFASIIGVNKVTWVYDALTGTKTSIEIPNPRRYVTFNFLIDAMGDLLGVVMRYGDEHFLGECFQNLWKYTFEVYRLEHTDDFGCCQWSKLNGIGDRILFLQDYKYGFCLRASDFKGLRGNSIYFKKLHWSHGQRYYTGCFSRYDMERGIIEKLVLKAPNALWFVPSLG